MPSNHASNDPDLVQPTQYIVPPNRTAKKPPPKPWLLPKFEPLTIDDFDDHGKPNLPPDVDPHNPFQLFSLFFTEEIMDKLVEWTNEYAELHPTPKEKAPKERAWPWQPTCREELYAYLAVLIHMGLTSESCIEDYWGDLDTHGVKHVVKKYMGLQKFEQLDRYFRVTKP
jgi:hypothetical protein